MRSCRAWLALALIVLVAPAAWALPVTTHKGLVVAAHPLAARAGAQVLANGGNAADALVATAFALAVVEPQSCGIGGGGFALLYNARTHEVKAVDFREVAPAAASPAMFMRNGKYDPLLSRQGGKAVAVPGAVAGYASIAEHYGTKSLKALVDPAATLAEAATLYTEGHRRGLQMGAELLKSSPAAAAYFGLGQDVVGLRRRQPELAKLLRDIGAKGPHAFYTGRSAAAVVRAVAASGGILTTDDLAHYEVRSLVPLEGRFRGHRVVTMPPPSAGGVTVLATLEALDRKPADQMRYGTVERAQLLAELFNRAYAARAAMAGDPRAEPKAANYVTQILKPETIASWLASIGPNATPSAEIGKAIDQIKEGPETSHLCVVDAAGNVALMTTTINGAFGSGVFVPELGIVLNNEMDDFSPPEGGNLYGLVGGRYNAVAPGKTPLSTMAPTLVFDGDRPWIGVGAAGGSTIATTITQIILHVVDDNMDVQQALAAPRLHSQFQPDEIKVEQYGMDEETRKALVARGYKVGFWAPRSNAQALTIGADGLRRSIGDPRGDGAAVAEDVLEGPKPHGR
jgi:gamma-glutamyltranspeptidase/glutathione hydrolase